jgi:hypothetical protein
MIRLTVLCFVTFAFVRFYVAVVVIAVVPVVVSAVVPRRGSDWSVTVNDARPTTIDVDLYERGRKLPYHAKTNVVRTDTFKRISVSFSGSQEAFKTWAHTHAMTDEEIEYFPKGNQPKVGTFLEVD